MLDVLSRKSLNQWPHNGFSLCWALNKIYLYVLRVGTLVYMYSRSYSSLLLS